MTEPFAPRVAVASLSGRSDADWARSAASHVGAAFLGGIALDGPTRSAARDLVARDREEFLPPDPLAFVADQLDALDDVPVRPAWNVRAASTGPVREAARVCVARGAILEINAHCRQAEMCAVGAGESLLGDPGRLCSFVRAAAATGATVSVKVRAGLEGVDLPAVAERAVGAGADVVHVDAMDSEQVVRELAAVDAFVVANNGVRGTTTAEEYLRYGADAVSVGRASDDPAVLSRVRRAVDIWFDDRAGGASGRSPPATRGGGSNV